MTHKRRLTVLEGAYHKRQAPPSLEAARRYFAALHKAYGPPNTPAPMLLDVELLEMPARMDALIDEIFGGTSSPEGIGKA